MHPRSIGLEPPNAGRQRDGSVLPWHDELLEWLCRKNRLHLLGSPKSMATGASSPVSAITDDFYSSYLLAGGGWGRSTLAGEG